MKSLVLIISSLLFSCIASANTFDHNAPRRVFTSQSYPWRAIGKLTSSATATTGCTAVLVARDLLLTNRHCVEGSNNQVKLRQYYFYLMLNGDIHNAASYVAQPVAWGPDSLTKNDWALLQLESDLGTQYGYFGIDTGVVRLNGYRGDKVSKPKFFEEALCQETQSPFSFLAAKTLSSIDAGWMVDKNHPELSFQCLAGYPGDLGGENLVLSDHCGILGSENQRWTHDCPSSRGSSGSPLFYREDKDYFITSLNLGGIRVGSESLLDVEFSVLNANHAVKTEKIIESLINFKAAGSELRIRAER